MDTALIITSAALVTSLALVFMNRLFKRCDHKWNVIDKSYNFSHVIDVLRAVKTMYSGDVKDVLQKKLVIWCSTCGKRIEV